MDRTSVRNTPVLDADPERTVNVTPAPAPNRGATYPFLLPSTRPGEIGRLGNYRVLRLLGEGGMGMVFEAEDLTLCRPVALKVMKAGADDKGGRRFLREARAMAALTHHHLVTVYQAGEEGGTVYLAMELLRGETLQARLQRPDPLPLPDVLRVAREVAVGFGVVHDRGLVHRDVKPANLWLEAPTGRVKILDFGLARGIAEDAQLTRDGVVVGTPAYLSPEQARGRPTDARSDLFSFGCVLYRMCTGASPFPAADTVSQLVAVAADDPVPVRAANPAVPESLADLVHRLLAKDPAGRPASAAVVADEIRAIERGKTATRKVTRAVSAAKTPRPGGAAKRAARKPVPPPRRRWAKPALIAAGAVLLVVALGLGADRALRKPPPPVSGGEPEAAAPAETVYLSDLRMTNAVNWPFAHRPGPGPGHGAGHGPPPGTFDRVVVKGRHAPRGLFTHASPPHERPTSVGYHLGGKYRTFLAEVSINDTAPGSRSPMTFAVSGDGRPLWTSAEVSTAADAQRCAADVSGVDVLTLAVTVAGDMGGAHGVWIDPRVTK